MQLGAFVILAVLVVGSAAGLILKRNPIHGALFLVLNLRERRRALPHAARGVPRDRPGHRVRGAIAVLFVFAIMVLIPGKEETGPDPLRGQRWLAVPVVGVFLLLSALILRSAALKGPGPAAHVPGGIEAVGRLLFTDYLFPFEITSFLLLAAIVGVLTLAKRKA